MTDTDIATIISVLSLIVAIVSPFISYRWMQNDIRVQRLKAAALRVSINTMSSVGIDAVEGTQALSFTWVFVIKHEGILAVGGVEILLECAHGRPNFLSDVDAKAQPPLALTKGGSGDTLIVAFEKSLAPSENVELFISKNWTDGDEADFGKDIDRVRAWVRSEAAPTVPVLLTRSQENK